MKHKRFLCTGAIIAVISLLFSGCSESDPDKVSLKDAMRELDNYTFGKYENIIFDDCKITDTDINELYKLKIKPTDVEPDENHKNKAEKLFCSVCGDTNLNYSKRSVVADDYTWICRSEDRKMIVQHHSSNSFNLVHTLEIGGKEVTNASFWDDNDVYTEIPPYKIYNSNDDITGIEYKVGGEMYKLTDAVKFAEDFVDSIKDCIFDEKETAKVSRIIVVKNDEYKDFGYRMIFKVCKNGVALDCNGVLGGFEDGGDDGEFMYSNSLEIFIPKKNSILQMYSLCHGYADYNSSERIDNIIPLSKAEQILSDTLAPLETYRIRECGLKYCCRTRRSDKETYYEPMWVFVTSEIYGFSGWSGYRQPMNIYVNAVTGECFIYYQGSIHEKGV